MHSSMLLAFLLPLTVLASPRPQWHGAALAAVAAANTTSWCEWNNTASATASYNSSRTVTVSASGTLTVSDTLTFTLSPSTTSTLGSNATASGVSSNTTTTSSRTTSSPFTNSSSTAVTTSTSTSGNSSSTTTSIGQAPTRTVVSAPFSVVAVRTGSKIDFSGMKARNFGFYLGGETASYCPSSDQSCPPGDETVFREQCSLAVVVPGGQQVYAAPDGSIGYTHPHSVVVPSGSVLCPFTYRKQDGDEFGTISTSVFGARGLMACPTESGDWQVFAALRNATVPQGDINECVGFMGVTETYSEGNAQFAAYEYT